MFNKHGSDHCDIDEDEDHDGNDKFGRNWWKPGHLDAPEKWKKPPPG